MSSEAAVPQFNIHDAKTNLSRIIDRVEHGEEIIISRAGTPVAKVVPLYPRTKRTGRGSLAGRLVMADDWDSPEVNETIAGDFGLAFQCGLHSPAEHGRMAEGEEQECELREIDRGQKPKMERDVIEYDDRRQQHHHRRSEQSRRG